MRNHIECLAVLCDFDTSARLAVVYLSTDVHVRLHEMYSVLGCTCVTCVEIEIDGEKFDLWCDDEALFKESTVPSLCLNDNSIIFGNFIISRFTNGEMGDILPSDIKPIMRFIRESRKKLSGYIKEGVVFDYGAVLQTSRR